MLDNIYQPGTLGKVSEFTCIHTQDVHTVTKLQNVRLVTPEGEVVGNLQAAGYFWCSTIILKTTVTCYSAVNDAMGCHVNCQDYVAFFTDTGEVAVSMKDHISSS